MTVSSHTLWGVREVAEFLGVPVATLYQWRHQGYGPRGRRVGRYLRYDPRRLVSNSLSERKMDDRECKPAGQSLAPRLLSVSRLLQNAAEDA